MNIQSNNAFKPAFGMTLQKEALQNISQLKKEYPQFAERLNIAISRRKDVFITDLSLKRLSLKENGGGKLSTMVNGIEDLTKILEAIAGRKN